MNYYINLDRSPERKEHFLKECEREKVTNITRFPALDGTTYKFSQEELSYFEKCDFLKSPNKFKLMGNQLSHFYIMKDIIKNEYPYAVVFQDDSILRKDFSKILKKVIKNLPPDAEMVNLGMHSYCSGKDFLPWDLTRQDDYKSISRTLVNEHICKLKIGINPCSLSYILTLQGAKNMVNYFDIHGFRRATDGNFNDYLQSNDIFYGSAKVLVTGNHLFQSTIFL